MSPRNGLPNISMQLSTIHITVTGLRVSSEEAKALQVVAFFQSGFFARYHCTEDAATFRIDLEILLFDTSGALVGQSGFRPVHGAPRNRR